MRRADGGVWGAFERPLAAACDTGSARGHALPVVTSSVATCNCAQCVAHGMRFTDPCNVTQRRMTTCACAICTAAHRGTASFCLSAPGRQALSRLVLAKQASGYSAALPSQGCAAHMPAVQAHAAPADGAARLG